ncbi:MULTISPECIES: DUF4190 domain-containing protein [Lysobacter]|uniref:DUF4190 domain-containing protein n=1 Tax=Lysobacter TaxID=68 RepID=UPI001F213644|nr:MULTISPECIES: DUF4190 domain-containing protein [Lysobacter]UJB17479.1 DUF4190 domain-containing protein [Lysobacter capsici]UJQ28798.1 DUF4190 domain-containing protein [Lysobacter gummosus]
MQMPVRQTNTLAVLSLIAGILGWSLLPFLGSIAAIITGHLARGQIRREPQRYDGDGLALGGLILGWSSVIIAVLTVIVAILFFGGIAAVLAFAGTR